MTFPTMKRLPLLLACLPTTAAFAADDDAKREAMAFFEKEVRPMLANRCYECHGEKKQKGSLRMDNIAYIKAGGDSGPALVAGRSGQVADHRGDPLQGSRLRDAAEGEAAGQGNRDPREVGEARRAVAGDGSDARGGG